ncbi:MAG: hypothetical protein ACRC0S_02510 [Fusobacteriaceae bacterium]
MEIKIKFKTNFSDYTERKNSDSRKWSVQGMHEMATYVDDESIP